MTLTSPTVYIAFQTAYATDICGHTVGKAYPGAIIGINPQSLYSMVGDQDFNVETMDDGAGPTSTFYPSAQFDFHDLNPNSVPPVSAYVAQPSCFALANCYTIWPKQYRPVLVLPSQVRDLDPAWQSCGLDWHGAWDPPIALQPAEVVDPVTTPHAPAYTVPASPRSSFATPASQTTSVTSMSKDAGSLQQPGSMEVQASASSDPASSASSDTLPTPSLASSTIEASGFATTVSTSVLAPLSRSTLFVVPQVSDDPATQQQSSPSNALGAMTASLAPGHGTPTSPTVSEASNAYQVLSQAQSIGDGGDSVLFSYLPDSSVALTLTASSAQSMLPDPQSSAGQSSVLLVSSTVLSQGEPYRLVSGGRSSAFSDGVNGDLTASSTTTTSRDSSPPAVVLTIASSTITVISRAGGAFMLGGQTMVPGSSPVVLESHTFRAVGGGILQDGTYVPYSSATTSTAVPQVQAVLTLGTSTVTCAQQSDGAYVIGTITLTPGDKPSFIAGHTISAAFAGLVQDGTTITATRLSSTTAQTPSMTSTATLLTEAVVNLGSSVAKASYIPGSIIAWAIGSHEVSAGGSAEYTNSHTISADASGALLEDGSTVSLTTSSAGRTATTLNGFLPVIAATGAGSTSLNAVTTSSRLAVSASIPSSTTSSAAVPSASIGWWHIFFGWGIVLAGAMHLG
ncbi:hypothetical protein LTR62_001919 [Meristemomyces frigidus]|uniref:Uncharacterized protein n=1 Tax=Meristemomyces frigidus TaxID=1508187 RepID=A0AAN7YBB8_9PEZI|nr:hypothetical protein LTR62_001919 [Meristemomyces frigidus]